MNALCPTRIAIEAEIDPNGLSVLKFKVTSGPNTPLRTFSVPLDTPPIGLFIAMPPTAIVPNIIALAGKALWGGLAQHPNFTPSVAMAMATALPERGIVIHIPAYAALAHNYPWEILHDGTAFVAPSQIAFTRTIEPRAQRASPVLDGDLKLLSIIAAANVKGIEEWKALKGALGSYTRPLKCLVLVSEPHLRSEIQADSAPWLSVEMVPSSEGDLLARLERFSPHLCHIFCHGSPLGLQIANHLTAFGARPLSLSGQLLASSLKSAWLVCLNTCATGAAAEESGGTSTVGSELVEGGTPFVTCMRENVPADAANIFTRNFMAAALADLSIKTAGQSFALGFDDAMIRARMALALSKGATGFADSKEWTLPILCTIGEPGGPAAFSVTRPVAPGGAADLVATIRQINDLKAALATGIFESQRDAIEQKIAELTQQLSHAPQGQAQ